MSGQRCKGPNGLSPEELGWTLKDAAKKSIAPAEHTYPAGITSVPEVVTSGLSVPTSASPRALLAATSRRVTLSGSLNLPPKAMCTAPSARDAPALRLSRSSIEPLRGVAPSASSRAAEMSSAPGR